MKTSRKSTWTTKNIDVKGTSRDGNLWQEQCGEQATQQFHHKISPQFRECALIGHRINSGDCHRKITKSDEANQLESSS